MESRHPSLSFLEGGCAEARRDHRLAQLEGALFAASEPLAPRKLARLAELEDAALARRLVGRLNELYERDQTPFRVEEIGGGYQLLTCPELYPALERFHRLREDPPLSPPMLETLAIIAYRQPICRADIEAIRGVQIGEILRHLLERGLVRIVGRDASLGRPFLYGTTRTFLCLFGLRSLSELPLVERLARPVGTVSAPQSAGLGEEIASDPDGAGDASEA